MRGCCIFSGSSHPVLVAAICERLGQRPAEVDLRKFSNGETSVTIKTSVRDQDVFIVQSGSGQINDNVMEMLIMISACKGGSARSITAVMPYFPYSRQSKQKTHRSAITARMIANLMRVAGVDHVITIDLHASQMQGFFKCPVDNLLAEPILAKWIKQNVHGWQDAVVVSKNPGGTKRVTSLADALKLSFGIVTTDCRRPRPLGTGSVFGSGFFDSMGTDGTIDRRQLEDEREMQHALNPVRSSREHLPLKHLHRVNGDTPPRRPPQPHNANHSVNHAAATHVGRSRKWTLGSETSSPLARSTIPEASAAEDESEATTPSQNSFPTNIPQVNNDDDGFEEPDGEETDERAQDVATGRVVHGHVVDDDAPSPDQSVYSYNHQARRSSSDEDQSEHMMQSFISTTSSRMQAPPHALGGIGDAAASDEEEEEALHNPEVETTVTLVGNVRDKPVLIIDDMIDKAGSWIAAAETAVKRGGATGAYCMATHGLFGGNSLRELDDCDEIIAIVVTNAFPIPEEKRAGVRKLVVVDISGLLSEAIRRNHHGESISQLYAMLD